MSEATTEERPNAFIATVLDLDGGQTAAELDHEIRAVVLAVREHGKKGNITLNIAVEPRGAESVIISASVKGTKPEEEKAKSIFFVGGDGLLQREHPKQTVLPFDAAKKVSTP